MYEKECMFAMDMKGRRTLPHPMLIREDPVRLNSVSEGFNRTRPEKPTANHTHALKEPSDQIKTRN
jgi:hypothetical protein